MKEKSVDMGNECEWRR